MSCALLNSCCKYCPTKNNLPLSFTVPYHSKLRNSRPGRSSKVHIFWEGHKILRNLHLTFDYSTYSQKLGEDFAKFCGLLRIYELYKEKMHDKDCRSCNLNAGNSFGYVVKALTKQEGQKFVWDAMVMQKMQNKI